MNNIRRIVIIELETGNDDFINDLLNAYGKSILSETIFAETSKEYGSFKIDYENKRIYKNEKGLNLTKMEFEVMNLFLTFPERIYSKEQIYEAISYETSDSCIHAVENMISRLRKKIENDPKNPEYIITVYGFGYKFREKEN